MCRKISGLKSVPRFAWWEPSLRYCWIIRNLALDEVPMSYLCGEYFKTYIFPGLSPPILTTLLTRVNR